MAKKLAFDRVLFTVVVLLVLLGLVMVYSASAPMAQKPCFFKSLIARERLGARATGRCSTAPALARGR